MQRPSAGERQGRKSVSLSPKQGSPTNPSTFSSEGCKTGTESVYYVTVGTPSTNSVKE